MLSQVSDDGLEPSVTTEFRTFDGLTITARGIEREEQAWLELEAGFDAQQAVEFAAEPVEEQLGESAQDDTGLDPRAEAEAINSTVTSGSLSSTLARR